MRPVAREAESQDPPCARLHLDDLRFAATLIATLARQVETAASHAELRKALEAIPAARDALEAAIATIEAGQPVQPRKPTLCAECFRTEGDAHRPWCPHA